MLLETALCTASFMSSVPLRWISAMAFPSPGGGGVAHAGRAAIGLGTEVFI